MRKIRGYCYLPDMKQLLLIACFSIANLALAEIISCKSNDTFIELPNEVNLEFVAAMIVNGLFKNGSAHDSLVRRLEGSEPTKSTEVLERGPQEASPAGVSSSKASPAGAFPAGAFPAGAFPAGAFPAGAFPADHGIWRMLFVFSFSASHTNLHL